MDNYKKEILSWRKTLDANLRKENSWLALAGLFWLNEGINSFGAGDENDIIFPDAGIPQQIGAFIVNGDDVKLEVTADTLVDVDGIPAKEASLRPDISGAPTRLKLGALSFILIQREDGFGIRLWDNNNPKRKSFPGRQWYPADEEVRIEASYQRYDEEILVCFERENGADFETQIGGVLHFSVDGKEYSFLALEDEDGDLFVMFRDKTNGAETYRSGRYLSLSAPKEGKAVIDFNRAYSPPCAFTPYATCPLPPAQNNLPIPIRAGEKKAAL